uniref:HNH endonuclease n=1 Tax=Cyanothece sp. (strain PCC 7425 / ATCC 29141) TaxID=395961 RepID=B8HMF3_CYAP4
MSTALPDRYCLREPIPEIAEAAALLNEAVNAHLAGNSQLAEKLIRQADMPLIRDWTESIWGSKSPYIQYRVVPDQPEILPKDRRTKRMPSSAEKQTLHLRDGYHCRFCEIPLIRQEVRQKIATVYPTALPWGKTNVTQHAAFQAMWVQYDHLIPYARGGTNDMDNMVITCAPCNFGRMNYTLAEVGLIDPRLREPIQSEWDGLERFLVLKA